MGRPPPPPPSSVKNRQKYIYRKSKAKVSSFANSTAAARVCGWFGLKMANSVRFGGVVMLPGENSTSHRRLMALFREDRAHTSGPRQPFFEHFFMGDDSSFSSSDDTSLSLVQKFSLSVHPSITYPFMQHQSASSGGRFCREARSSENLPLFRHNFHTPQRIIISPPQKPSFSIGFSLAPHTGRKNPSQVFPARHFR